MIKIDNAGHSRDINIGRGRQTVMMQINRSNED